MGHPLGLPDLCKNMFYFNGLTNGRATTMGLAPGSAMGIPAKIAGFGRWIGAVRPCDPVAECL